jgi:hypothetical protein
MTLSGTETLKITLNGIRFGMVMGYDFAYSNRHWLPFIQGAFGWYHQMNDATSNDPISGSWTRHWQDDGFYLDFGAGIKYRFDSGVFLGFISKIGYRPVSIVFYPSEYEIADLQLPWYQLVFAGYRF